MAFQRYTGSVWSDPTNVRRWSGSAWVEVGFVRRWSGSAWVDALLGVNITNRTVGSTVIEPGTASVTFECRRNGGAYWNQNAGSYSLVTGQWWEGGIGDATIGDGYETKRISGTINWPTTWSALSTARACGLNRSTLGVSETSGVIGIRKIGDTSDGVTATITLRCEVVSNA